MPIVDISSILGLLLGMISSFSWILYILVFVLLFLLTVDALLFYQQLKYKSAIQWSLLEINIPRQIMKGPKAMEQFFNALYSLRNAPGNLRETYYEGQVTKPFSLEVAAMNGKTVFYLRVPTNLKIAVEAILYGQYPDIEIYEGLDYVDRLPSTFSELESIGYDLFGIELSLGKEDPFPIKNYELFETKEGDERLIDPMATLLEVFGKLQPEESLWLQIIVKPASDDWKKRGQEILKEIRMKSQQAAVPGQAAMNLRTPGEDLRLKLIEKKLSQPGFDTMIRYVYLAPKAMFNNAIPNSAVYAYFNQFVSELNGFKKNSSTATRVSPWTFPYTVQMAQRLQERKQAFLAVYRNREHKEDTWIGKKLKSSFWYSHHAGQKSSIFSSDELATFYHMPTDVVLTAPVMQRIESKHVSPPANLPS